MLLDFITSVLERGLTISGTGREPVTLTTNPPKFEPAVSFDSILRQPPEPNLLLMLRQQAGETIEAWKKSDKRLLLSERLARDVNRRIAVVKGLRRKPPIPASAIVAVLAKAGKPLDRQQLAKRLRVDWHRLIRRLDALASMGIVRFVQPNKYEAI